MRYLDNKISYDIINNANNENKVIAAICIAPLVLAHARALKGKKATVWSSDFDKSAIKELEKEGGIYIDQKSVIDGNIITANGPFAIKEFCENILNVFNKKE